MFFHKCFFQPIEWIPTSSIFITWILATSLLTAFEKSKDIALTRFLFSVAIVQSFKKARMAVSTSLPLRQPYSFLKIVLRPIYALIHVSG